MTSGADATQNPAATESAVDRLTGCAPGVQNEHERIALLHSLELLDTPSDPAFDAVTQLASQVTGRPIALIGLVERDLNWFKSRVG